MKNLLLISFLLFTTTVLQAQQTYKVGISTVSIEPDQSVYSLALAGYGFPREGRFSIEWEKKGTAVGITCLTGLNKTLYAIKLNGMLIRADASTPEIEWENMGMVDSFKFLAGLNDKLYATSSDNGLFVGTISKTSVKWVRVGQLENVTAFTASESKLYLVNDNGGLEEGTPEENRVIWKAIGKAEQIVTIAGNAGRLYSVTDDQVLWQRKNTEQGTPWVKIGYNNGLTYNINIKQIAVANERLFAATDDNTLYVGKHNSLNDLSTQAVAIQDDSKTAVIVAVDLTGFNYSLAREVKKEIYKRRGIPAEAILINASHTHFAPVTQYFPAWGNHQTYPDSLYFNAVVKTGIIKAIEQALDNMTSSVLYFGRGETNIGYNRSLSGPDALHDPALDVVKIAPVNKKEQSLLFTTACHPVFRNEGHARYTLSPNFPGFARTFLEEGANLRAAMFLQGCAGDINPKSADPVQSGFELARDVLSTLNTKMEPLSGKISLSMDSVLVPVKVWSKEKIVQFKLENSNQEGNLETEKNVRWADQVLSRYKAGTIPEVMPVYIQTINIGNWKLVGLSREVVTEYSLAIKKIWPDKNVSVLGYTNDVSSYLPNSAHVKAQTYEGYGSFLWYAEPAVFPENVFDLVLERIRIKDN